MSEGCIYSIKKIRVVASKGSYRPLCGSRQIQTREKNIVLIDDINKLTISDVYLLVMLL